MLSANAGKPNVVGWPGMLKLSLTVIGTPCSGPTWPALGERPIGGLGVLQRPLAVVDDDRVDRRVQPVDALEVAAQQLDGRHLPGAHRPGELPGRAERERRQRRDSLGHLGHCNPQT